MKTYKHFLVWLCVTKIPQILSAPSFTSWPQAVGTTEGGSVTLTWTLNENVNTNWDSIQLSYKKPTAVVISTWYGFTPAKVYYPSEYKDGKATVEINVGSPTIKLTLNDVQPADVVYNYECQVSRISTEKVTNSQAWILLYGVPNSPVVSTSPQIIIENNVVTLTCSTTSTTTFPSNLPTDLRPTMQYRWLRDMQSLTNDDRHTVGGVAGNTLTIDKVQRQDHQKTYTCIAQETGSELSNSKDIILDVTYAPGSAEASSDNLGSYFEGVQADITISCNVSDRGNPPAMFQWSKDGTIKGSNTTGSYVISSGQLSVSEHDGLWQCTPVNVAGRGQPATTNLTVYAKPAFINNLSNQTIRADQQSDLDVLCNVRSRPAADVTWQYEGGSLPVGVTVLSEANDISGKLTTVKKRLKWLTASSLTERRRSAGIYTCVGRVAGEETKQSVYIDVQHGPYDINIMSSDNDAQVENDTLTMTCAATCNPTCTYKWLKDGQQVGDDAKIELRSIKREQQGTYTCIAGNGIGSDQLQDISVQVNYPPEVRVIVTPSGNLVQGSEVTLMCIVDGRPSPSSITWTNITETGLTELDSSQHNDTHRWLTLSDVDILESGTYQCTAENGVRGSPVSVNKTILVYGPARLYKTDPLDLVAGVSVGDMADFKVWIIARPLPTRNEWRWKFSPNNSSNTVNTDPGQVSLSVSGNLAVLSISSVTVNHYGDYYIWTGNSYGGWNEGDLKFSLKAPGRPLKPVNFHVIEVTAVSIRVQWTTGFNGGLSQTFTIRYKNEVSGEVFEKSDIPDTEFGSGQTIMELITDNIEPETSYQLQIFAINSKGETAGEIISITTLVLAKFVHEPDINIDGDKARIHFVISGALTHIKVENCVQGTDKCRAENVTVPQAARRKRQTSEMLYDFTAAVMLADPERSAFVFSFWIYQNDVLLSTNPLKLETNVQSSHTAIIVSFGILLAIIIVGIILTVLWRIGFLTKKICCHYQTEDCVLKDNNTLGQSNTIIQCEEEREQEEITETVEMQCSLSPRTERPKMRPVISDVYSEVKKKSKPKISKDPAEPSDHGQTFTRPHIQTPYVNIVETEMNEGDYSEVQVPHLKLQDSQSGDARLYINTKDARTQITKPLTFVGEDGTTYAELDIINKPPNDPQQIHGIENLVEYASIDFNLLKKNKLQN